MSPVCVSDPRGRLATLAFRCSPASTVFWVLLVSPFLFSVNSHAAASPHSEWTLVSRRFWRQVVAPDKLAHRIRRAGGVYLQWSFLLRYLRVCVKVLMHRESKRWRFHLYYQVAGENLILSCCSWALTRTTSSAVVIVCVLWVQYNRRYECSVNLRMRNLERKAKIAHISIQTWALPVALHALCEAGTSLWCSYFEHKCLFHVLNPLQ